MSGASELGRALVAESLKIRKTLALWLVFVLPAAPVALQFFNYLHRGEYLVADGVDPWLWMGQNVMVLWAMLMLPLFVALETGLLAGIEHSAQGWKHLFSLRIRRRTVYGAKMITALVLVAAAHVMAYVWIVVAGTGLSLLRPDLGFSTVPWNELLAFLGVSFVGSWLVVALHAWISLRWPSLILNVGVAVVAVFGSFALSNSGWRRFYPWMVSGSLEDLLFARLLNEGILGLPGEAVVPLLIGSAGGVVVFLTAPVLLARRDVM